MGRRNCHRHPSFTNIAFITNHPNHPLLIHHLPRLIPVLCKGHYRARHCRLQDSNKDEDEEGRNNLLLPPLRLEITLATAATTTNRNKEDELLKRTIISHVRKRFHHGVSQALDGLQEKTNWSERFKSVVQQMIGWPLSHLRCCCRGMCHGRNARTFWTIVVVVYDRNCILDNNHMYLRTVQQHLPTTIVALLCSRSPWEAGGMACTLFKALKKSTQSLRNIVREGQDFLDGLMENMGRTSLGYSVRTA